ncbi:MAG: CocE/NonD family hydrolase [Terriglobales bacterium]|jgi:putative CocE/NonD family hydrolase
MRIRIRLAVAAVLVIGCALSASGQTPSRWPTAKYEVRLQKSVMVPMRDGVKLSTDLYLPETTTNPKLPVVLVRTPYNKNLWRGKSAKGGNSPAYHFAGQGYVVAVQDVRGRYESQGDYRISADDVQDGFDTDEWIARQPWSNGKVGTYGCSYVGDVQVMQAKLHNPHLATMIPQAAGSSIPERGFGVLNGGAIELAAAFGWFHDLGSNYFLHPPAGSTDDFYEKYGHIFNPAPTTPAADFRTAWRSLPLIDMMKEAQGPPSDFEAIVSHPAEDGYWHTRGYLEPTDRFDTPSLQVNSWYDFGVGETLYQFNLMRHNALSDVGRNNQFIVVSPTTHCASETATEHTIVGHRDLGDARFELEKLYLQWFDYWLKGIDNGVTRRPHVLIYVMGRNEWRAENEWPLARTEYTKYFLRSDGNANSRMGTGSLSTRAPGYDAPDRFTYDPATPVPSVGGPVCCTMTEQAPAGSFDQSEVEMRQDVLVYSTSPLQKGVEITGPIKAVLYVSSSARDTDYTAKLVDVYPDGTAYNVQEGIKRARYRDGYDKTVWMELGRVYKIEIDMEASSNYFAPGHRIRLEISSSNFPRFDRNLNTGGHNYDETKWAVAHNQVLHTSSYPSHVLLPVIP